MNYSKITLLLFAGFIFVAPLTAQEKASKEYKADLEEAMSTLDEEQKKNVLVQALRMAEVDSDKEMKRLLKKIPASDRDKLLMFAKNYQVLNERAKVKQRNKVAKDRPKPRQKPQNRVVRPNNKTKPPANTSKGKATAAPTPSGPTTTIEFVEKEFDFGTITQGEKVSYVYKFKNTGTEPLTISNARGSCGCTVPKWPKEAIAPGEMGEVKVEFNSRGKRGKQIKRVTITANTSPPQTYITIKGNIAMPSSDQK